MIVQHRWYLTLDDSKAVKEGHPEANSLYAIVGALVDDKEAARLGICNCPDKPEEGTGITKAPHNKAVKPKSKEV